MTPSLNISPTASTRRGLESLQFTARGVSTPVVWSVNHIVGGNSTVGTISTAGLYTAPGAPSAATVTVTVSTTGSPALSSSSTVTLMNAVPVVTSTSGVVNAGTPFLLTVQGAGFAPGATAVLGSTPLNLTWQSSTQVVVSGSVLMPPGDQANLAISNPNPGAARSNLFPVPVKAPGGLAMLTLNAATGRHAISPDIYGLAYGPGLTPPTTALAKQMQLTTLRWGGDASSNYNWTADTSNTGSDYYFINFSPFGHAFTAEGFTPDQMITGYTAVVPGIHSLITVPVIPWVADNSATECSYPVQAYGQQQATIPLGTQVCGNGVSSQGTNLVDDSTQATYIANSPALQQGWIEHLVSRFGTAAQGGVAYYELGNEPSAWHGVHRDLEPNQPLYDQITPLHLEYAAMIKSVDATAKVLGPGDFTEYGWTFYTPTGSTLYAGQYYLQQMAAYAASHNNQRVLDDFDEHWTCPDMSSPTAELNSTRTLWDPSYNANTSFEQYLHGPVMMLPRFQSWIATYYPGTQISVSEYECVAKPGSPTITDALAEADILGIFGSWNVALANNFNTPKAGDPLAFSYLMYRNYDGNGSQFGDVSVTAQSTVPASLAVYGAVRSSDGALTVMVINKVAQSTTTTLALSNFASEATGSAYIYSGSNLQQITHGAAPIVQQGTVSYNFPASSITLLVFPPS